MKNSAANTFCEMTRKFHHPLPLHLPALKITLLRSCPCACTASYCPVYTLLLPKPIRTISATHTRQLCKIIRMTSKNIAILLKTAKHEKIHFVT